LENWRHIWGHNVVWHAETHLALEVGRRHQRPYLVVEGQQTPRAHQQPLAARGQAQPATLALEQLPAQSLLEALDLLAHGRLGEVDEPRRGGHPAGLGGSKQAAARDLAWLIAAIAAQLRIRRAIRKLAAKDDRMFKDIGMGRCEIEYRVRYGGHQLDVEKESGSRRAKVFPLLAFLGHRPIKDCPHFFYFCYEGGSARRRDPA